MEPLRKEGKQRAGWALCTRPGGGASMEPLRKEGKQTLCRRCNSTKGGRLNGAPPKGGEAGPDQHRVELRHLPASMEPLRKEGKQLWSAEREVMEAVRPQWSPSERRGSRRTASMASS